MQGRRSAVGVLDVEVGALVGPDRAAARGHLLDDCLQAGARVDVGQVRGVEALGQPGELADGEGAPGRARVEPYDGRPVLAVGREDEIGAADLIGVELAREEPGLVAAELAQRGGRVVVHRLAGQPLHAGALHLEQAGVVGGVAVVDLVAVVGLVVVLAQAFVQAQTQQPLRDGGAADVAGADIQHAERLGLGGTTRF